MRFFHSFVNAIAAFYCKYQQFLVEPPFVSLLVDADVLR